MKIMIGIPCSREYKPFWDSMAVFLPEVNKLHNVEVVEVRNKKLVEARNVIAQLFMESDKDYLLFLDDDHSGHTIEMLEALIRPNYHICAMKCYGRTFPYACTVMNYSGLSGGQGKYQAKNNKNGYDFCDLVGFGMTLIKRSAFEQLDKPYFVGLDDMKEDNYFCDNLIKKNIRPMACFDYVCTHNGIDGNNVIGLRNEGMAQLIEDMSKRDPNFNGKELLVFG